MRGNIAAKRDYTEAQLPHSRREVFFDICRLYPVGLLRTGLTLLAFAVPLLICLALRDENELGWLAEFQAAPEAERAEMYTQFQLSDSLLTLAGIVGYVILSLGVAGALRVVRQHAWEEPVNLKLDLPKGIQQNWRPCLLLGFLTGCWVFLSRYRFEDALYGSGGWTVLNLLPALLGLVILLPILGFLLVNTAVYSNTLGQNFRLSLYLQMKKLLPAAGISILMALLPLAANGLPWTGARALLRVVTVVISPFLLLIWFLWCYEQLDAFFNPGRFPELIGRGLVREEAEESDYHLNEEDKQVENGNASTE